VGACGEFYLLDAFPLESWGLASPSIQLPKLTKS
jgi:hypothetical protein